MPSKIVALAGAQETPQPPKRNIVAEMLAVMDGFLRRIVALEARPVTRDGRDGQPGRDGKDGEDGANGKDADHPLVEQLIAGAVAKLPSAKDGLPGRNGVDGKDGAPGAPGLNGKDGSPGSAGKDGRNGVDGKDGKDADPELFARLVAEAVASIPPPRDGQDGKDGVDARPPVDGKDGRDGRDGAAGVNGKDGIDGKNGTDGRSIVAAHVNADGCFILQFSDGATDNLGCIRGPSGRDGDFGPQGPHGERGELGPTGPAYDDLHLTQLVTDLRSIVSEARGAATLQGLATSLENALKALDTAAPKARKGKQA